MFELRLYLLESGRSPFEDWFAALDSTAAAKVTVALARLEQGNLSSVKPVGGGVLEYRIDWGQASASTSAGTATKWRSCWLEEQKGGSRGISSRPRGAGRIT
jgi:hypothetical protein